MNRHLVAAGAAIAAALTGACNTTEPELAATSGAAASATAEAKQDWSPVVHAGGLVFSADSASRKLANCPAAEPSRAALAIFHLGGNGAAPTPENTAWPDSPEKAEAFESQIGALHQIRAYLRPICVRLVVVGTYAHPLAPDSGYFAGQPTERLPGETFGDLARRRQRFAATRLREGIDFVFRQFPDAPSYTYLGGSMSSVLGASMVNDLWSKDATDPAITRLGRVVVSGVTAGNYVKADAATSPRPTATTCPPPAGQSAGFSCVVAAVPFAQLDGTPVSDANLFPPGKGIAAFLGAGGKLNMFSGTADALFGYPSSGAWTGPDGVASFQEEAHVPCSRADCADDASDEGSVGVTRADLAGATHHDTWTFPRASTAAPAGTDNVPHFLCRRIARDLFPRTTQEIRTRVCSRPVP